MAIAGGRLDEAAKLLQSSAVAKHATGQQLSDRLITELLKRAQLHLDQGRLQPARMDADLAGRFGGQQVAVHELLQRIENKYDSLAGHAQDAAKADALERLNGLIKTNDHEQTIHWLATQPIAFRRKPEVLALIAKPIAQLKQHAITDFDSGRLDRCAAKIDLIEQTGDQSLQLSELKEQLERCRAIDQAVQQAKFDVASTKHPARAKSFSQNILGENSSSCDQTMPSWNRDFARGAVRIVSLPFARII